MNKKKLTIFVVTILGVFFMMYYMKNTKKSEELYKQGKAYFETGNYSKAERFFRASIRKNRKNWKSVQFLGKCYIHNDREGPYLKAAEILKKIASKDKTYYDVNKVNEDVAEAYFKEGLADFFYGLKLRPVKFYGVYLWRAVEYNTNSPKLLFFAKYVVELGHYDEVNYLYSVDDDFLQITISHYYKIIKRFPYYWAPYYRIGYYYLNYKKQPKRALHYLEKSYKLWSKKKESDETDILAFDMLYTLSQCYAKLGYKQKSNIYKKKALKIYPKAETYYKIYYQLFQFDKIKKGKKQK